ncbi:integrase family protein [Rhodomicrobium vannielii ATCC 17100]|uniref:Integrase family protein n=1 Tax=Rhodomicrobium vannielii (strain ATCC 17100 / DSM 162 / LMG 4299 / NCIMB 10020 / ATH 3.1.1) TaxID=648757 RepID=E3I768_RHOVT|nr:site-specific integrase [Rhodomicrobium vannielii]ADP70719.1 integrase family protein [Rhodomicrobium vannielii ATCC 17100]
MAGIKITLTGVQALSPGSTLWDGQVKGFAAKANANGSVSFVLKTRVNGRQRWVTIGKFGSPWTVETARREALRLLGEAASGNDIGAEKQAKRAKGLLFGHVADQFIAIHFPKLKPRTRESYGTIIRLHLKPAFGATPIADIRKTSVATFHARHAETPRNANHALSVLSKIMNWAEEQGLRPAESNPCRNIRKYRETKRERYLSPDELARLGAALAAAEDDKTVDPYIIAAIRLLLLTGARLSEILTLRWTYVDTYRRILNLPDSKTGAKVIPLNQAALDLLGTLPRLNSNPFVLVGRVEGQHLVNLQKPWRRIRKEAGLDDVRIHDLRHSFASVSVGLGGSLPVIGRVLGHSQPATTARYAHVADKVAAELVEAAGALIGTALQSGGKPSTPQ